MTDVAETVNEEAEEMTEEAEAVNAEVNGNQKGAIDLADVVKEEKEGARGEADLADVIVRKEVEDVLKEESLATPTTPGCSLPLAQKMI